MTRTLRPFGCIAFWVLLSVALTAQAKGKSGKTQIELQVKPATAQLFIDDKPQGKVGTNRVVDVTPGFHVVRVTSKGDEHEERVKFAPGQKTTYTFEFDEAPAPTTETAPDPVSPDSTEKTPDPLKP
jgi:hypothetical protein